MPQKKFIITKDECVANKLLVSGFKLMGQTSGVWTFINNIPKNFNFNEIDKKLYTYSNILHI